MLDEKEAVRVRAGDQPDNTSTGKSGCAGNPGDGSDGAMIVARTAPSQSRLGFKTTTPSRSWL